MDNRTEQLADGVWRVEVALYVNAYVLANDGSSDREGLTLVDAGWRRSAPRLVRSIRLLGLDARAVGDVLLSHWHADHAGGAARFAASSAAPAVHAGAGDLAAPGHTPGHCAFVLPDRGVLLACDAVWNIWWLRPSPRFACSQLPSVPSTLARLAGEDFTVLGLGHGPPVDRDARRRLEALVP